MRWRSRWTTNTGQRLMEMYPLTEHAGEGCRRMVWELRYKSRTFHIAIQDTLRSIEEPEAWVWVTNHVTTTEVGGPLPWLRTEAGDVSIIGMGWRNGKDPAEIYYPTPEAAVEAATEHIDDWLRDHDYNQ